MVKQGDLVIASGKLYETSKGVSYGTIAGSKVEYSKDSGYEVFETSVSITAVSYTHLDVYKRQGYACSCCNRKSGCI